MSNITKQAESMAELTCKLARICKKKEDEIAAKYKLAPSEFRFIKLYASLGANVTIKDFRKVLGLTPGRMTHLITALEKKKFLKRKTNSEDKRFVTINLLPKVEPMLMQLKEESTVLHKSLIAKIKDSDREIMVKSLEAAVAVLDAKEAVE